MHYPRLIPLLISAVCLTACGASAVSERTKLMQSVKASVLHDAAGGAVHLPNGVSMPVTPALTDCLSAKAGQLPIGQLRQLASPNPPESLALLVLSRCVSDGVDVSGVRQALTQSVAQRSSTMPPALRSCVLAQVAHVPPAQLAQLFLDVSQGNRAAARNYGFQLGVSCLSSNPATTRALLIKGMQAKLQQSNLPPAFTQCMIDRVNQLPKAELDKLTSAMAGGGQAGGQAAGEALGRELGTKCAAQLQKAGGGG
jgi:hypothetical protein